jgi:hypothetical protein
MGKQCLNLLVKTLILIKELLMITKKQLSLTLEKLPDEFSIEVLIEKLILLDKIERADKESERGEIISEDELDQQLEKWFK